MKKTQTVKKSRSSNAVVNAYKYDEMQQEYKFDYSKAKPNRFASRTSHRPSATGPDSGVEDPEQPKQRLHFVTRAREVSTRREVSTVSERVRGLKEMVFDLLKEIQSLEHDGLVSELTAPQNSFRLDIEKGIKFEDVVRQFETNIIQQALSITGGNQARAARLLGIKQSTLIYKTKLYNL